MGSDVDQSQTPKLCCSELELGSLVLCPAREDRGHSRCGYASALYGDRIARRRRAHEGGAQSSDRRYLLAWSSASRTRRQLRICPHCDPAQSVRAFMSSIMRWRSGLTVLVVIGNSEAGSDAMTALSVRNKFGWDRPRSTMTFSLPDANGDIGDEGKIIIELVPAPKREE